MDNRFQKNNKFQKFQKKNEPKHNINGAIRHPEVRVVMEGMESTVMKIFDAIKFANSLDMDLIEISADAKPPVCRVMPYDKFLYQEKRAQKDKEKKNRENRIDLKELQFTPNTDENDVNTKARHAERFLKEGDKVKAVVKFSGREIVYKDKAQILLLSFAERLLDFAKVESMPKLEGKRMFMILAPKK